MISRTYFAALLCVLAAGCSQQDGGAPSTASGAPVTENAEASSAAPLRSVALAEGYKLPFAYQLRSQRHTASGAKFRHVVVVEFKGEDAKATLDKTVADLKSKGFTVDPPADHEAGVRVTATGKDSRMTIDIYGPAATTLKFPDTQGLAYITWVDHKRR